MACLNRIARNAEALNNEEPPALRCDVYFLTSRF
jgi:hypothetical protein